MTTDAWMDLALQQAQAAADIGEVPVGAILVYQGECIAKAHNLKETRQDVLAHAEILVIQAAQKKLANWRLTDCELYVTLEPCIMCMGTILHSRIAKVVYGAKDLKWGGCGSVVQLNDIEKVNHQVEAVYFPEDRCSTILKDFFKAKRAKS
ncbi:nucleoside deaminase [bacterium]|jgi:tRNA(adenine34) deaminase|nr:nucleoside deaminase [bacterium]